MQNVWTLVSFMHIWFSKLIFTYTCVLRSDEPLLNSYVISIVIFEGMPYMINIDCLHPWMFFGNPLCIHMVAIWTEIFKYDWNSGLILFERSEAFLRNFSFTQLKRYLPFFIIYRILLHTKSNSLYHAKIYFNINNIFLCSFLQLMPKEVEDTPLAKYLEISLIIAWNFPRYPKYSTTKTNKIVSRNCSKLQSRKIWYIISREKNQKHQKIF